MGDSSLESQVELTDMESVLSVLAPKEALTARLGNPDTLGRRSDGRSLDELRQISCNTGILNNRLYSCTVKRGNTTVLCGLSLEVCQIKPSQPPGPSGGYIVPNVEVYSIATAAQRPGRVPLESTQNLNCTISQIMNALPNMIAENALAIGDTSDDTAKFNMSKWCYVLYVDVTVVCDDGGVLDTVLFSISKCLSNGGMPLQVPRMRYDKLRDELFKCGDLKKAVEVNAKQLPISVTFSVYSQTDSNSVLFLDPTRKEQDLSDGNTLTVVGTSSGQFISIEQNGARIPEILKHEAMSVSATHFQQIAAHF